MKKDILKVIAAINVYGLRIYGKTFCNIDCGKGNLSATLRGKGLSVARIKKVVQYLKKEELLHNEPSDIGGLFYIWGSRDTQRSYLKLMDCPA